MVHSRIELFFQLACAMDWVDEHISSQRIKALGLCHSIEFDIFWLGSEGLCFLGEVLDKGRVEVQKPRKTARRPWTVLEFPFGSP